MLQRGGPHSVDITVSHTFTKSPEPGDTEPSSPFAGAGFTSITPTNVAGLNFTFGTDPDTSLWEYSLDSGSSWADG